MTVLIQVETNIHLANDPCLQEHVILELIKATGFEPVDLVKSLWDGDKENPELVPIKELVDLARKNFDRYGDALVKRLQEIIDKGEMFPLNEKKFNVLREIFEDHTNGLIINIAGHRGNLQLLKRLKKMGLIMGRISLVDIAFRMGKMLPTLRLIAKKIGKHPSLKEIIKRALGIKLTPLEKLVVQTAENRAAGFLRPILDGFTGQITQNLLEHEERVIREEMVMGHKKKVPPLKLASKLRERVLAEGNPTNRDFVRVARTEFMQNWNDAVYLQIKQDFPNEDPIVFKRVGKNACKHCRRIWGDPSSIIYYRLSAIERNPSNRGRKAIEWIAQIGPIHPNCTEGALQVWVDLARLTGGKQGSLPTPLIES